MTATAALAAQAVAARKWKDPTAVTVAVRPIAPRGISMTATAFAAKTIPRRREKS
jgi:hypothetical protein